MMLVVVVFASAAHANSDVLVERDSTIYGKITQVRDREVSIARGCNTSNIRAVPKERVKYIQFDNSCQPHKFDLPTSPLQVCDGQLQQMYKVYFKGTHEVVYVTDISLDKTLLRLRLAKQGGSIQGPIRNVDSVIPSPVCLDVIPEHQTRPRGFCYEPPFLAVNFNLKPIYNNQIFTRGFTVFIDEVDGKSTDAFREDLTRAFGGANAVGQ
jgi:hypothetical protein